MFRSLAFLLLSPLATAAFSLSDKPVSKLLKENAAKIDALKQETAKLVPDTSVEPYSNDVFYLRYAMLDSNDMTPEELLKSNLEWRLKDGKAICESAQKAVAEATAGDGKWKNDAVRNAAPNAAVINKYLTPSQCLTTALNSGDLIYCIRAGKIGDADLMSALGGNAQPLIDFFIYCKEVNSLVANQRSLEQDRLVSVLVANDLVGVKLIGGDASFRNALSEASKVTKSFYPTLNGPTLLLNLPRLLGALVKLFTPLFPKEVSKRIRFEQGPLAKVEDLTEIGPGGSGRAAFLKQIDDIVYND